MEWNNHKNEEAMTWEDEYLDQHDRFRNVMIIEMGEKPPCRVIGYDTPQLKKESNEVEPILCDTPEKAKQQFEVIGEDEEDSISLYLPQVIMSDFLSVLILFFGWNYTDIFFGVDIVTPIFCVQYITNIM